MLPPFRLVTSCAPGGTLKKSNGIEQPPAPTMATQDECRPYSAGELGNVIRRIRTAHDDVIGAVLAGQPGFSRVDRDDSRAGQLTKELNGAKS